MGSILARPEPHFTPAFLHSELLFGERYAEHHGGLLPNTPFWRYLEDRSEIDPARFRHWHPVIGRLFADDPGLHPTAPVPPTQPQQILPPPIGSESVSEPGGAVLLGVSAVMYWIAVTLWRLCHREPR